VSKRGLPTGLKMRHDAHYVEEFAKANKTIGEVLPIDKVFPNPEQPRTEFGDMSELVSSIKEQGVLEPLLVQPKGDKWMIIAGERRWRASNEAGLTEVPCMILDIDDKTVAEIALVENLQRKDLNIWEIADGLADLAERFSYTHDQIAQKIGKSRSSVTESLAIAGLPTSIRERCRKAKIAAKSTLVEISREFDEAAMHTLLDNVGKKPGGVARKEVRAKKQEQAGIPVLKSPPKEVSEDFEKAVQQKPSYSYVSKENGFTVEIKHENSSVQSKTDLLRALKEAFDAVKAGE